MSGKTYTQADIPQLQDALTGKTATEIIEWASETFGSDLSFASSLGLEDQVLTALIVANKEPISIFTLDTGRLFPESYNLLAKTEDHFGQRIEVFFPNHQGVESMVEEEGVNLFYKSIESRKRCCQVRKLEPLKRALSEKRAWICGLRRDQALTRQGMQVVEWDALHQMPKINPLIDWSDEQVLNYIEENKIPYNPLHDQGFISIGCASCTRAIKEGQHVREGRWWWESPEQKECGLHYAKPLNSEKKEK